MAKGAGDRGMKFEKIYNKFISELRIILQATIDNYIKVHLGEPKQYFVKFSKDIPYKFEFVVFNSDKILFSYSIAEILEAVERPPQACYDMIVSKLLFTKCLNKD